MMLMLLFQLGNSQYAIPVSEVVEVAPFVQLDPIAMAPAYIGGLFNYRGTHVPIIDLCRLVGNTPCNNCYTTRIILVNFELANGDKRTLGLLAERVTETISIDEDSFASTGLSMDNAPYLGHATHVEQGLVQQITVSELLPENVQSQLFPAETG